MKVVFHKNFQKRYKRLPLRVQDAFGKRLNIFLINQNDPLLNNHSVENIFPECRSINVTGDYRAIYRQDNDLAIFILIGSHAELYG